jgi:glutamate-ammonia-ligase adenylyltransferase
LRKVEHRIQMEAGQQTHRLPTDPAALDRLGRRTGLESASGERPGDVLLHRVRGAFAVVDEIYQRVIHPVATAAPGTAFELKPAPAFLPDFGRPSFEAVLSYFDAQAPEVARIVREADLPERAQRNAVRLLTAIVSSPERFAAARAKPAGLRRAIELVGTSAYLTDLLVYHPEDLETLDLAVCAPADDAAANQLDIGLEPLSIPGPYPWASEPGLDLREKMAVLRRQYRARLLALGTGDLAAGGSVFAMLKRWTHNAACSISSALAISRTLFAQEKTGINTDVPFFIFGMGRLGLSEFDLASDADLVFVAHSGANREDLEYCTRLAAKTIEVLSSYTRDGVLFPVDSRLRPRGQEGELVVTLEALLNYIAENAQAWELPTYLKAHPVAGDPQLARLAVSSLRSAIYDRFADFHDVEGKLHQMRRRLEREVAVPSSNTKTAPGGYYDVDFAVSCTRLRRRVEALPGANMPEQIAALRAADAISAEDAATLTDAAGFLRSLDHIIRLVTGKAPTGLPENPAEFEATENVARRWNLVADGQTLAVKLHDTRQQLRYVYRRLVGAE